ncbi:hypothetical protein HAHE_12680 [Haloferula helveola]|uniref:Ice-binding protein C-terminal domain-containing protein n=1 Tax=Haloferula helveola TaxID=490095 RepID=A0ABM7RDC6_9BACT|nr:hypothetical protein HAHE_12680 [Haloferula helveola]
MFPLLAFAGSACLTVGSHAATVAAVQWGGDYVSADTVLADDVPANRTGSDGYGDPDGPIVTNGTDSIAGRGYSSTRPFSPGTGYTGTSGTFYGGGSVERVNSTANDGFSELSVLNQGPNDSIHFHVDTGGDVHTFHLMFLWDKADFLSGLDAATGIGLTEGEFGLVTSQASGHHTDELLRWVVRDGNQLYVSEDTTLIGNNSVYSVSYSSLLNWAPYDPNEVDPSGSGTAADLWSLDFDEGSTFLPHTFTDVTGVGFYIEHEAATGPIHVHIEGFSASMVPEPSTPLIVGLAALLWIWRFRRR